MDVSNNRIEVVEGDFLARTCESLGGPFHKIVMNPPFMPREDPDAYIDHVLHAYTMLAPGGRLSAVTPTGWIDASDHEEAVRLCGLLKNHGRRQPLPEDSFKQNGLPVRADIITLDAGNLRPRHPRRTPPVDAQG